MNGLGLSFGEPGLIAGDDAGLGLSDMVVSFSILVPCGVSGAGGDFRQKRERVERNLAPRDSLPCAMSLNETLYSVVKVRLDGKFRLSLIRRWCAVLDQWQDDTGRGEAGMNGDSDGDSSCDGASVSKHAAKLTKNKIKIHYFPPRFQCLLGEEM